MSFSPDLIDSVPDADLDGGTRNGRVLSDTPAARAARERRAAQKAGTIPAARSRGAAKPRRNAPRTPRTPKTLYPEIAAFLSLVNMGVTLTPWGSKYEPTGAMTTYEPAPGLSFPIPELRQVKLGDELDEIEISAMAAALDRQCQRSPRFKRYVEMVLNGVAGGGVLAIAGIIGARRVARHGIIDPTLDAKLGRMLAGDVSALASFTGSGDEPGQIDETPNPDTGERPPVPTPDDTGGDFESM